MAQDAAFGTGMLAGVLAGLYDSVEGIAHITNSPLETYEALKSLFNSSDVLDNVSDALKQSYIDRINQMEMEYQKAGASGSFNAGVEGGKLVTDIVGLLAGGAGLAKGGAVLTKRIVAKVASKAASRLDDVLPPTTWKASEGAYSPKTDGVVTNVEYTVGKYEENSLPYKDRTGTVGNSKDYMDILSPEAKQHILYGDNLTSGGHLFPGIPEKRHSHLTGVQKK